MILRFSKQNYIFKPLEVDTEDTDIILLMLCVWADARRHENSQHYRRTSL